ncbi:pectate lyase [Pontibacter sp. E15-1]|uniref:pectate lyase n=1 Tax=Pontibacter sp. E15-1 TaxID=2919918 RepID=UPI001F4F4E6C|nr:pectate lyase [Pontibacter sp. E15-1]MCJ8167033.1 pectate lyase [Pontibacter sp. E15-1]
MNRTTESKQKSFVPPALGTLRQRCVPAALFWLGGVLAAGCAATDQRVGAAVTVDNTGLTASAEAPVKWGKGLLAKDKAWYGSAEASRIADNLLLYQHTNGGWNKNTDMALVLTEAEKARLQAAAEKGMVSTIDNGATYTQLEYLANVYDATGEERYKDSFLRGLDYLFEAQYENGGWPQFYPIRKGYYEYITFNDGAMIGVMELLRDVAKQNSPYAFVDKPRQKRAAEAIKKGLDVILKTQIEVDGKLTAWCAQHDHITLAPQKARDYELPSISGGESIGILKYLLEIEKPDPHVEKAVEGAVSWLNEVKITGIRLKRTGDPAHRETRDVVVVNDTTAPPLLARFYEIETNKPMFSGRDGVVRHTLAEIEQERRAGYSWYIPFPEKLLDEAYPRWRQKWVSTN